MSNIVDNSVVSKHLGKTSEYIKQYDPSLLVGELRSNNRTTHGIDASIMHGYDIWTGYEFSCLLDSGMPCIGMVIVRYSAQSEKIVESKSMKLYWNSFNMTPMGADWEEAYFNVQARARKDIGDVVGDMDCEVKIVNGRGWSGVHGPFWIQNIIDQRKLHETLEDRVNPICTCYNEKPGLLKYKYGNYTHYSYHSALLKSNCRVTGAPDFGDIYIDYKGLKHCTKESLLQYIVSFRDECHFHEEICETVYDRLWKFLQPDDLTVECIYTRRGGWSIVPMRTSVQPEDDYFESLWFNTLRQ